MVLRVIVFFIIPLSFIAAELGRARVAIERVLTIVKEQSTGRLGALLGMLYDKKSSGIVLEGELLYPWEGI